jgi:ADP-heptose:LPS heptosyltransferase
LGVPVRDPRPRFVPDPRACEAARARRSALGLGEGEPYLLASVGAREGSAKGLPAGLWAAVLGELARELPPVLACGPGEERSLEQVRRLLPGRRLLALLEPAARLPELLAHCQDARLVLAADSGPRHLARALGKALVVVSGPTDPRHCGLDPSERQVRVPVPCGPCHRERCPLASADERRCLTSIDPERVVAAALELLASPAADTMAR